WRWRFYTGETIFDTFWVQQLRYLARSKKLGQRQIVFTTGRPVYELGEQVRVNLRILDSTLLPQLSDQISVDMLTDDGQLIAQHPLQRQEGQNDLYIGSWTADTVGRFRVRLPSLATEVPDQVVPI